MSLTANISNLATAIGTDVKATNAKIGNLGSLTTTAKGDLVAAVNEVKSSISGAGASINDAVTNTSSVWSSSKTNSAISAAVTAHEHTAADVDSGASSDGQVLTSDGAGGAAWEPLPPGVQGVGVSTVWAGSQAAYDAISTPDPNTLYFVTG